MNVIDIIDKIDISIILVDFIFPGIIAFIVIQLEKSMNKKKHHTLLKANLFLVYDDINESIKKIYYMFINRRIIYLNNCTDLDYKLVLENINIMNRKEQFYFQDLKDLIQLKNIIEDMKKITENNFIYSNKSSDDIFYLNQYILTNTINNIYEIITKKDFKVIDKIYDYLNDQDIEKIKIYDINQLEIEQINSIYEEKTEIEKKLNKLLIEQNLNFKDINNIPENDLVDKFFENIHHESYILYNIQDLIKRNKRLSYLIEDIEKYI